VEGDIKRAAVGYAFSEIRIHVHLMIAAEEDRGRALKLLHKTQGMCLVSRALSVEQKFEPRVQVGVRAGDAQPETSHPLPISDK